MTISIVVGLSMIVLLPTLNGLVSKEAEGWLAVLPFGLLRLARAQLPSSHRSLYDEWSAELFALMQEMDNRPLTRLFQGIRFSVGLIWAARVVAREIGDVRDPDAKQSNPNVAGDLVDPLIRVSAGARGSVFQVLGRQFAVSVRQYGTGYDRQEIEQLLEEVATTPEKDLPALAEAKLYELYAPRYRFYLVPGGYFEGDVDAMIKTLYRMIMDGRTSSSRSTSGLSKLFRKLSHRTARAAGAVANRAF